MKLFGINGKTIFKKGKSEIHLKKYMASTIYMLHSDLHQNTIVNIHQHKIKLMY